MTFFQIFSSIVGIGFLFGGIKVYKGSQNLEFDSFINWNNFNESSFIWGVSKSDDKQNELKNLQ